MPEIVDLRSDTVTRPTAAMLHAMTTAPTGDDGYGEDPTVRALEDRVAGLFGHEAALLMPSGTMANQVAIRLLVPPGHELLCEASAHLVTSEGGAAALYGGISTRSVACRGGLLTAAAIQDQIHTAEHRAVATRAIAVEQTANRGGGLVYPIATLRALRQLATEQRIAVHCDGARIWNAVAASGVTAAGYGALFDTLAVCLSKGLGAPVGSLVVASRARIEQARTLRRALGGTMRQAGVLAGAGLVALAERDRLLDDHANARTLARLLTALLDGTVVHEVETNIVHIDLPDRVVAARVADDARSQGVLVQAVGPRRLRCVTHRDVDGPAVRRAANVLRSCLGARPATSSSISKNREAAPCVD